jgi:hypothetical protein
MTAIDRRRLLSGIAAATLAGMGAAGVAIHAGGQAAAMRASLERLLGPFFMDNDAFEQFATDYVRTYRAMGPAEADVLHLLEILGPVRTMVQLEPHTATKLETFDRRLLTEFTLATQLTDNPNGAHLSYNGLFAANPCSNPYAQLT